MSWPAPDDIQYWSGVFTILGVPIGLGAVLIALWQISLSKRASSVSALVALHEALRACWRDYLTADAERKSLVFGDLCNAIEVGCAALTDRMLFGESKRVLEAYLLSTLKIIERHDVERAQFIELLQEPKTFINIHVFLRRRRRQFRALGNST
jgi:hypothetical protein